MAQASKKVKRTARIDIRATRAEARLMGLGAARRGEKLSQFVVKTACAEAVVALGEQKHFELPPDKFDKFIAALDRPAKAIPTLQKLFAESSLLEK